jgi:hypothetical protein
MNNVTVFGDWADSFDAQVTYSEKILDQMVEEAGYSITSMVLASTAKAFMSFSQGFIDMGRFGNGVMIDGGWKGAGKDVLRGISIVGVGGAVAGRVGPLLQTTQVGSTCVWTSAANSIRWTGQRFLVTVGSLAKAAGLTTAQIGSLARAEQIVKIQQALTALGIQFRIMPGAGNIFETAIRVIRANPGGVVNFSVRLFKLGKDIGGHRLYATYTKAAGLIIKDPNYPLKVFRTLDALRKHLITVYKADRLTLSDSPMLFIKDAWIVSVSHIAQRATELSNLAIPLVPQIHVTAEDAVTARSVIRIHNYLRARQFPPIQKIHVIAPGENLFKIAERYYREAKKWPLIYAANQAAIGLNPNNIQPGKTLKIPSLDANN